VRVRVCFEMLLMVIGRFYEKKEKAESFCVRFANAFD
jgi:hypothetical protein